MKRRSGPGDSSTTSVARCPRRTDVAASSNTDLRRPERAVSDANAPVTSMLRGAKTSSQREMTPILGKSRPRRERWWCNGDTQQMPDGEVTGHFQGGKYGRSTTFALSSRIHVEVVDQTSNPKSEKRPRPTPSREEAPVAIHSPLD